MTDVPAQWSLELESEAMQRYANDLGGDERSMLAFRQGYRAAMIDLHMVKLHVLRGGRALCAFSLESPIKWPSGHMWSSRLEPDGEHVTCLRCKELALRSDEH